MKLNLKDGVNMKVNIEMTPDEFKELLVPGEKQTDLLVAFQKAAMDNIAKMTEEYSRQYSNAVFRTAKSNNVKD
ncbi:MAG: hypothetical protein CBB72_011715 [Muricauda sp. TMED12]|nr:MAG: hypothetical protein CBB72_011715 [Muricauda sp. TMED12]